MSSAAAVIGAFRVKKNGYTFRESKLPFILLPLISNGIDSSRKEFVPLAANSFFQGLVSFLKVSVVQGSKEDLVGWLFWA